MENNVYKYLFHASRATHSTPYDMLNNIQPNNPLFLSAKTARILTYR